MVRSPVRHHRINIAEYALTGQARNKPGRRPGRIGPVDQSSYAHPPAAQCSFPLRSAVTGPTPSTRLTRTIVSGISASGLKVGGISTTTELAELCRTPASLPSRQASISSSVISHHGFITALPCASLLLPVASRQVDPGIDQMDKAFLRRALRLPAGHPFHSLRTPVASAHPKIRWPFRSRRFPNSMESPFRLSFSVAKT